MISTINAMLQVLAVAFDQTPAQEYSAAKLLHRDESGCLSEYKTLGAVCNFEKQLAKSFMDTRFRWRSGAISAGYSVMEIFASDFERPTNDTNDMPDSSPQLNTVPLSEYIPYVYSIWAKSDPDFPSPSKMASMELDELMTGDWNWSERQA